MTAAFLTTLRSEHVGGGIYRITAPLIFQSRDDTLYEVEIGFEYDGCSVPWFLWWKYPPFGGDYDEAAAVHDKLYRHAEQFAISRFRADEIMLEGMEAKGVTPIDRTRIYQGVRAGGWYAWHKHRLLASTASTL